MYVGTKAAADAALWDDALVGLVVLDLEVPFSAPEPPPGEAKAKGGEEGKRQGEEARHS